jgi:hypothetical protein
MTLQKVETLRRGNKRLLILQFICALLVIYDLLKNNKFKRSPNIVHVVKSKGLCNNGRGSTCIQHVIMKIPLISHLAGHKTRWMDFEAGKVNGSRSGPRE